MGNEGGRGRGNYKRKKRGRGGRGGRKEGVKGGEGRRVSDHFFPLAAQEKRGARVGRKKLHS